MRMHWNMMTIIYSINRFAAAHHFAFLLTSFCIVLFWSGSGE
jgi:hypothetical protein